MQKTCGKSNVQDATKLSLLLCVVYTGCLCLLQQTEYGKFETSVVIYKKLHFYSLVNQSHRLQSVLMRCSAGSIGPGPSERHVMANAGYTAGEMPLLGEVS